MAVVGLHLNRLLARFDLGGVARDRPDDASPERPLDQRRVDLVWQRALREFGERPGKRGLGRNLRASLPAEDATQRPVDGEALDQGAGGGNAQDRLGHESSCEGATVFGRPARPPGRVGHEGFETDHVERGDEMTQRLAIAAAATRGSCARRRRGSFRLFKLRLTANVKRMIEKLAPAREWVDAGQGFEAKESAVRLVGWSRKRRVIVLRRRVGDAAGPSLSDDDDAPQLSFVEIGEAGEVYEHSVLVTSLNEDTELFGQLYRDRGDGENIFDEMKNQWGWGGYTTHDLARCRLAARLLALFYNWWNIFVRLADPSLHREAVTSRPLFLSAIATRTRHARQTTIRVTSSHAKAKPAAKALAAVAAFLRG